MHILIVYDDVMMRENLRLELENQGYAIMEAANGTDGLHMARNHKPALIISGISLYDGGFRFLHQVRTDKLLGTVGFILYTSALTDNKDKELALRLGADAVIPFPEGAERFLSGLRSVMEGGGPGEITDSRQLDILTYLIAANNEILTRLEEKSAELVKTKEEINERERRYQRLLESVNDYIYTVKIEAGRPISTTHGPGCVAVTGFSPEEFEDDSGLCFRMIHEEERESIRELTQRFFEEKSAFSPFQHRIIHKDGRVRWIKNTPVPHFDRDGRLVAYDGLISDITDYKKLEDQFQHAQKMEAVGVLAGGIAHDFNNILTAMIGYGDMLQRQLVHDHIARNNVDQIMAAAERAANLVHGLLAFSRKQVMHPRPFDLNKIIKNIEKLLSRLLTEDIELLVDLTGGETTIMADPGQIDQILMNLVANARDAMPKGGVLTIETTIMNMDPAFLKDHGFGASGTYVMVSISDTGMGMDDQTRQRIFEPFYTTKPMGKGTGLGLSIVYGIVKQHCGFIDLQSRTGEGTTFRIYFPRIEAKTQEVANAVQLPQSGGNQTILIADDDIQVRSVVNIILSKSGYKVLEAEDGEMAVRKFKENLNDIDLLILDMVMPRKNGMDAFEEIRKLRQNIKAIFISGYTADVIDQKGVGYEDLNIVAKPISPSDLLLRIRETLKTET